jgi:hypothetical protein
MKRKYNPTDEQFEFEAQDWSWRNNKQQRVLGKELVIIQPEKKITEVPSLVEFNIKTEDVLSFGPNSRFYIEGDFEYKTLPTDVEWTPCNNEAEAKLVIIQPNWFDNLVKRVDTYHGGQLIHSSDEGTHVPAFINTMLYALMDKNQKRVLCPDASSPGYAAPTKTGDEGWSLADGSEWRKYAKDIFNDDGARFSHVFMQQFPMWQGSNYFQTMPKILPTPAMSPLKINVLFSDFQDSIFKKAAANTKLYRFMFKKFELWSEQLRVSPSTKASFQKERRMLNYPGVCRLIRSENIPATVTQYRHTVQDILFPEGILLYALPKEVVGGTYKYKNNKDGNVLSKNNTTNVAIKFGEEAYFWKQPNMGDVRDSIRELNSMVDYYSKPPFGIKVDPEKMTMQYLENGFNETPYPHIYLNLCNFADNSRILPFVAQDASILAKPNNLDIIMNFDTGGAEKDVTYIAHLFYMDINTSYDQKTRQFSSPYIMHANQAV